MLNLGILYTETIKRPFCEFLKPGVKEDVARYQYKNHVMMVNKTMKEIK